MRKPSRVSRVTPHSRDDILARRTLRIFGAIADISVSGALHGRLSVSMRFRENLESHPGINWIRALRSARVILLIEAPHRFVSEHFPMFEYAIVPDDIVITKSACSFEIMPVGASGERAVRVFGRLLAGREPYSEVPEVAAVSLVIGNDVVQLRTNPASCRRVTRTTAREPS